MPKYALVVSADTKLIPGANAIFNAMNYYGDNDIDIHFLYWPGEVMDAYLERAKATHNNIIPINLEEYKNKESEYGKNYKPKTYLKMFRTLHASRLRGYDAVGFGDADRVLTSSMTPYFDLAANTGKILMVEYKFNQEAHKAGYYYQNPILANSGCPYDPCATFFQAEKWGRHFGKIPNLAMFSIKRSEMSTVNYMLIVDDLLDEIIGLPNILWTARRWSNIKLHWDTTTIPYHMNIVAPSVSDKFQCRYRGRYEYEWEWPSVNTTLSNMIAIHGRFCLKGWAGKKLYKEVPLSTEEIQHNNSMAQILEAHQFFNYSSGIKIDSWFEGWVSPIDTIDVSTGLWSNR